MRFSDDDGSPVRLASPNRLEKLSLAAARHGDFAGLLRLLDADVVLRADVAIVEAEARASAGAPALVAEMRGVDAVA